MLAYNVKLIFENLSEKERYLATLRAQRYTFNECSKIQFTAESNNIVWLHKNFYSKFRVENPEIFADIVVSAENECLSRYRSIKACKHKIKKPIEKKKLCIRQNVNTCNFKILDSFIALTCIGGKRVKCSFKSYPKLQELIDKYPVCDPLTFEREGEIYLNLTFKTPEIIIKPNKILGVDLGINRIVATSEGKIVKCNKFNSKKRKIRYNRRQLQSKKSKGSKSAKRHLKKIRSKEKNINKNFSHHVVNEILNTQANIIVIENLSKIKQNPKNKYKKKFNNKLSQIPFFQLREILTYKATLKNKEVQVINPKFTSQIDHRTGKKDGERKGARYIGKDNVILDADLNAANNIAIKSKLPLSCCKALDGQAIVIRLNACGRREQVSD